MFRNMLGLQSTVICCTNVYNSVRHKSGNVIIRLRKETKQLYGPVKKDEPQSESKATSTGNSSKSINDKESDGELYFTMNSTNHKNLKHIKLPLKTTNYKKQNKSLKFQMSPLEGHIPKPYPTDASSSVNRGDDESRQYAISTEDYDKIVDRVDEQIPDLENTPAPEEKSKYSIEKYPLISTVKDNDQWQSSEIISLKPTTGDDFSLPGVTRILNETMSEQSKLALENWKKRMILELGEEGFQLYSQKLKDDSSIMHSLIEKTLKNQPLDVPDHLSPAYNSANVVLKDINNVRLIESHVIHPTVRYRGFADCVAHYKGNLCLIDWKKSDKPKELYSTYDAPLQISAYIGALNHDSSYPFQVKKGILAIAYTNGNPPSVFELSQAKLEFYWKEWLKRVEKYYAMR